MSHARVFRVRGMGDRGDRRPCHVHRPDLLVLPALYRWFERERPEVEL